MYFDFMNMKLHFEIIITKALMPLLAVGPLLAVTPLLAAVPLISSLEYSVFPVLMPSVSPLLPAGESYLCTGVSTESSLYIRGFMPQAAMETVHHLMVIGCQSPDRPATNLWNCGGTLGEEGLESPGSTCPNGGPSQVMYMWSRNGSHLLFPEDTALQVGGNSTIQFIVLQVHYLSKERIPPSGDSSGVLVSYTSTPANKVAGIVSLHVHGTISPLATSLWDSACQLSGSTPIHPWAFLGHTHQYGRLVTAWKVRPRVEGATRDYNNSSWDLLGSTDPMLPQTFYPVHQQIVINPGDVMASRCVMTSSSSSLVQQGLASHMEMCDLFLYYWAWAEHDLGPAGQQCTNKGPPQFTWTKLGLGNIPEQASLLTPL